MKYYLREGGELSDEVNFIFNGLGAFWVNVF
jgi:hypothetical protein